MNGWIDGRIGEQDDGWMDTVYGWVDTTNIWVNGWMCGWMGGQNG